MHAMFCTLFVCGMESLVHFNAEKDRVTYELTLGLS